MGKKYEDLTGQKFGRLIVIKMTHRDNHRTYHWDCLCNCGKIINVSSNHLKSGHTKSCGCYKVEESKKKMTKHGLRNDKLYNVYYGMIHRCFDKKNISYSNYGGRGITVDSKWLGEDGFINFKNWALENGYKHILDKNGRNTLSIDRIDSNGNYSPLNCRWVTNDIQNINKRNTILVVYDGIEYTLKEFAERVGLSRDLVYKRYNLGWSVEKIANTKVRSHE